MTVGGPLRNNEALIVVGRPKLKGRSIPDAGNFSNESSAALEVLSLVVIGNGMVDNVPKGGRGVFVTLRSVFSAVLVVTTVPNVGAVDFIVNSALLVPNGASGELSLVVVGVENKMGAGLAVMTAVTGADRFASVGLEAREKQHVSLRCIGRIEKDRTS